MHNPVFLFLFSYTKSKCAKLLAKLEILAMRVCHQSGIIQVERPFFIHITLIHRHTDDLG